ncbi:MAG: hypothetical protein Q9182_007448 [Xanthomendoza sp. 2 TL-2023]
MLSRRFKDHDVSLENGMSELFDCVNEAIRFFGHFDHDYQQDIQRIRRYCDQRLIDAVWMQKAQGPPRKGRAGGRRRDDQDDEIEKERPSQSPTLRNTMKQLNSTMETALDAVENFPGSQRRPSRHTAEDVAKIRKQLHRTYQNLRKSFLVILEKRSEMEHVTTELEMLSLFLGRNGAADGNEGGRSGSRSVGQGAGVRRTVGGEVGGQSAYEAEMDAPTEEWSGGQGIGQGEPFSSKEGVVG